MLKTQPLSFKSRSKQLAHNKESRGSEIWLSDTLRVYKLLDRNKKTRGSVFQSWWISSAQMRKYHELVHRDDRQLCIAGYRRVCAHQAALDSTAFVLRAVMTSQTLLCQCVDVIGFSQHPQQQLMCSNRNEKLHCHSSIQLSLIFIFYWSTLST